MQYQVRGLLVLLLLLLLLLLVCLCLRSELLSKTSLSPKEKQVFGVSHVRARPASSSFSSSSSSSLLFLLLLFPQPPHCEAHK